jgi:hypothetical protein
MLLSRGVLGVEPLAPGFALCSAPRGLVEVEWSGLKWPGLKAQVSVPPGARARLPDGREVGPGKHAFALAAA